jgi:hypothetical protein
VWVIDCRRPRAWQVKMGRRWDRNSVFSCLLVFFALFRHPVRYNGSFKFHDFHAAARGRAWTCRPRRGTRLGKPLGGRVRSSTVCGRCLVAAGGFGLAVHPVLYNGTIKSHECQPTARSGCGPSTAGGPVRGKWAWAVAVTGTVCFRAFWSFSLCSATPCSTTARSNRTTFMRRHVLGVGHSLLGGF